MASSVGGSLTQETAEIAFHEAGLAPSDVGVGEYLEAMAFAPDRQAVPMLDEGAFDVGGCCAVSPSGGLVSMGHPIDPTGVRQIGEIPASCAARLERCSTRAAAAAPPTWLRSGRFVEFTCWRGIEGRHAPKRRRPRRLFTFYSDRNAAPPSAGEERL
ncbi:MAG: hypothetical protein JO111_15825 [Caulobacteraceae bacterium]|nr:hypothetical protein [Caulobacteraceae bacterium]